MRIDRVLLLISTLLFFLPGVVEAELVGQSRSVVISATVVPLNGIDPSMSDEGSPVELKSTLQTSLPSGSADPTVFSGKSLAPSPLSSSVDPEPVVTSWGEPTNTAQSINEGLAIPLIVPVSTVVTAAAVTAGSLLVAGAHMAVGPMIFGNFFLFFILLWNSLLERLHLRRRRVPWGVIYDVETGEPIPMVVVVLKDHDNQVVETRVTDWQGTYSFLLKAGIYHIEVIKANYHLVQTQSDESGRNQQYRGETLKIANVQQAVSVNIALRWDSRATLVRFAQEFDHIRVILEIGSVLIAGWSIVVYPTLWTALILALSLFVASRRWIVSNPSSYGVVVDENATLLPGILINLVSARTKETIGHTITDGRGRYRFSVRPGEYYLRIGTPNWSPPVWIRQCKPMIITEPNGGIIDRPIALRRLE